LSGFGAAAANVALGSFQLTGCRTNIGTRCSD
jgi:hypothetical protein